MVQNEKLQPRPTEDNNYVKVDEYNQPIIPISDLKDSSEEYDREEQGDDSYYDEEQDQTS